MSEKQVMPGDEYFNAASEQQKSALSRRGFVGVASAAALTAMLGASLSACGGGSTTSGDTGTAASGAASTGAGAATGDIDFANWDAVLEAAKGQTAYFYGWGGSEPRNTWLSTSVASALKEKYDVTLELVGMDINDILTKLSGEKQAGVEEGSVDMMWINGENFFSARENDYLWGPFSANLPNFQDYVDAESPEITHDFGTAVENYEAPYGKAQMQMWVDSAKITSTPKNPDEFLKFCEEHKGMVTYPEPGDFTGTAFISCLIAGVIGKDEFEKLSMMQSPTADEVKAIVQPGLDYLKSLNPYLWKEGVTYPSDSMTVGTMYADGELVMNMGYSAPEALVADGTLPDTTRSFLFDTGTVGNTNFMAIAYNSPRKAAAMVAINEIMSPQMQLEQFETLSTISVLDLDKLSQQDAAAFDAVELGVTQLPLDELLDRRVVEAAGPVIPLLEQLWLEQVPGK